MASKDKKNAKMSHNKKATAEETVASKLVKITAGGHRINDLGSGRTKCGVRFQGWEYSVDDSVTCAPCKGEAA